MSQRPPPSTEQPKLYGDLARLWPLLSPSEDYTEEAETLRQAYETYSEVSPELAHRPRLLELGAGGGHVLVHLQDDFECTATDLSAPMLEECKKLVPAARQLVADMRSLRLEEKFEVVLLLDAVDYMTTRQDLMEALQTAKYHLAPGGVLLVAPTYTRESFVDGDVADDGAVTDTEELTYFSYVHDPDVEDSEYEMILLFLLRDRKTRLVKVVEDRHHCGLFSEEEWASCLHDVGLTAHRVEDDKAWTLFAAASTSSST